MKQITPLATPITVGIVGLGRAGWNLHLQPILQFPEFKIVAVADPLPERRTEASALTGCAEFATIDELLAGSDAQLVAIATPSATHREDTQKVLASGRHCLTEKPVAFSLREAQELFATAAANGLGLFVNHTHLHCPEFYALRQAIASGDLGELFSLRAFWGSYARRWDWQTLKKNHGGALNNTCPHMLSIVLPLLGSPVKEVFSDLRNIKDAGDAEDHVHAVLRTESGVTADIVVSSAIAQSAPRWLVCGTRGTLSADAKVGKLRFYDGKAVEPLDVLDAAAPGRQYLSETLPWQEREITLGGDAPVPSLHRNVLDVLTGRAEPIVTPESVLEVVRVSEMLHAAAR